MTNFNFENIDLDQENEYTNTNNADLYAEYRKCAIMSARQTAIAREFHLRGYLLTGEYFGTITEAFVAVFGKEQFETLRSKF